jgi:hypothetical protein
MMVEKYIGRILKGRSWAEHRGSCNGQKQWIWRTEENYGVIFLTDKQGGKWNNTSTSTETR